MFHRKWSQGTGMWRDLDNDRQKENASLLSPSLALSSSQPQALTRTDTAFRALAKPASAQPLKTLPKSGPCISRQRYAVTYLTTTWTNHILETKRYFKTGKQPLNIVSIRLTLAKFVLSETQKSKISSVLEPSPALVCQGTLHCNAFLVCRFYGFIDSNYMCFITAYLVWSEPEERTWLLWWFIPMVNHLYSYY